MQACGDVKVNLLQTHKMAGKQVVAVDFETYYDKDCSVRGATAHNYVRHEKFDAFLVSIYAPDEFSYVGHPKDFDWTQLDGRTLIAHNAQFENAVLVHLILEAIIAKFMYTIHCTADMCVYLQHPRSLAGAVYATFGKTLDKGVRDNFKGMYWDDIVAKGWAEEVLEYALNDSIWCWKLWEKHSDDFPEMERKLSQLTRDMGENGVTLDEEKLLNGIDELEKMVFDSETSLPWTEEYDSKYNKQYPPLSVRGLALTCQKYGIEPPSSTAENSDERIEWEQKHGDSFPWIEHMSNFRRANKHLKTLKTMHSRLINGRMPYSLKYYGAEVTGRWSGDSGFNTQNMPRDAIFGVNIRNMIVPKKDHSFVICDLSQIEPRCLAYLCGDSEFLEGVAQGVSPYQVHAVNSMDWVSTKSLKKEAPDLYLLAKVRVLSLGYGASFQSFVKSAANYGASHVLQTKVNDDDWSAFETMLTKRDKRMKGGLLDWFVGRSNMEQRETVNAWLQVEQFRESNPKIVELWKTYDKALKASSSEEKYKSTLELKLPCGRPLRYFNVTPSGWSFTCFTQKKDSLNYNRFRYMYGSRLVENACQAMARSVFANNLLALQDCGYAPVLQVHDEVVLEVPSENAESVAKEVEQIMSTPPPWAESLPVAAEAQISNCYKK